MLHPVQMTASSVIYTILFSLLFAALLAIVMKSNKLLGYIKYELLLASLLIPILKIIIPVEVLPWSRNINVSYILPDITRTLYHEYPSSTFGTIQIWSILCKVVPLISAICIIRLIVSYYLLMKENKKLPEVNDPNITGLVTKILKEQNRNTTIIVKWTDTPTPSCIIGLFKPTILLSRGTWALEDLECVLRHEIAHYLHGDLLFRYVWMFIKAFCWWNPAIYILDKQLSKIMEIRADEGVLSGRDVIFKKQYMQTIVALSTENMLKTIPFSASFQEKGGLAPRNRIEIVGFRTNHKPLPYFIINLLCTLLILALTFIMCCFIIEPKVTDFNESYEHSKMVTSDNSYFIANESGTYDMYMDGIYCATLSQIPQGTNIPVYSSLEEATQQ